MSINKLIVILFLVNPVCIFHNLFAMETGKIQKPDSKNLIKEYKQALDLTNQTDKKKGCEKFEKLSKKSFFVLHELVLIRLNQHCVKNPSGENLKIKNETLIPFLYQARFEREMEKKNFRKAYRVFNKNRKWIEMDPKDFDTMATGILNAKLTPSEKKELLKELRERSPRFIPHPKKENFIRVARDYRNNRQFKKALFYYNKIKNDPKTDTMQGWQALRGIRMTYRLERWTKMKEYIRASRQWADFLRDKYFLSKQLTEFHHNANIEYIRTLWTEKGQKQARPILQQLERELVKGSHSLQQVYWLRGRMAEERKEYERAVFWLNKASKEKSLSESDKERVLWSLAWNQRRIKKFQDSQKSLKLLKKNPKLTLFAKSQYLYWEAENLESMGQTPKAKKILKNLSELDPYGYYGALAYRKLQIPFPPPPQTRWTQKDLLKFFEKEDQIFFTALIQSGEWKVAQSVITKKVKINKNWKTPKWVHYLVLLQKSGNYPKSFELYHKLSNEKQRTILKKYPFVLFPQPYEDIVTNSAIRTKTSPTLIYSIMKQESGFDIKARSPADAFGLLQLIPQMAKKISREMTSVKYRDPEDLFKPEVVIPLGAKTLGQLFSKFNSHFIPAVASYNSNEKTVLSWIQSRFYGDPIAFIEDIPYRETKNYVRLVMGNYIVYSRFNSTQESFNFPEICLAGLEKFKKTSVSN